MRDSTGGLPKPWRYGPIGEMGALSPRRTQHSNRGPRSLVELVDRMGAGELMVEPEVVEHSIDNNQSNATRYQAYMARARGWR